MTWQLGSVIPVWLVALVGAVLVGLTSPPDGYFTWLAVVFAGVVVLTFAIQLGLQRTEGFVVRAMASVGVAIVILAAATGILALLA